MKKRMIVGLVLALAACEARAAESVRIEKKTEELSSEVLGGREAAIHTPVFHGIEDPAVVNRLQESIAAGLKDATGSSPEDWAREWREEGYAWLVEIDYKVTYNAHGLLSLAWVIAGMGAYPSETHAYTVLDLKTGRLLTAKDLFKSHEKLAAKLDRLRAAAVEKAFQEYRPYLKDNGMTEEDLAEALAPARESRFTVENLDTFRLDETGVTFVYDFDYPHVSKAFEPNGECFLTWKELRPYVNPQGLLGSIIR